MSRLEAAETGMARRRSSRVMVGALILTLLAACGADTSDPTADRHDRSAATMDEIVRILHDPSAFGSEDEIVDLIASHATASALMDDRVFGALQYREAFYQTLYADTMDAQIEVHAQWLSDDGSEGGFLWMWSGTNTAGAPFELAGVSLVDFTDDGQIAHEYVTYPYPDAYVRAAVLGPGTPAQSTTEP